MIRTADDVIDSLTRAGTLDDFRRVGDAVQKLADPRLKNICTINGTEINPFFVPNAQPGAPALNSMQWLYVVSQARAAAANGNTRRMMVAAPMKSGSTFISKSLATAFQLPRVSLIMLVARAYDYAMLGAATRAHEIDELALISACCRPDGFLAHHHMLASPFLASQAALYNLEVILIRRNIFDMLVSLDDFTRKYLAEAPNGGTFFRYGVPASYTSLDFDQRISRLLDRNLNFYLNYYMSWTLAEQQGLIKPFWISYEDEISGGTRALSGRIAETFAKTDDEASRVAAALGEGGRMEHVHFNKGVAGRGQMITGRNRERVLEAFADFSEVADWSELLA
jgi:hypothetical protein